MSARSRSRRSSRRATSVRRPRRPDDRPSRRRARRAPSSTSGQLRRRRRGRAACSSRRADRGDPPLRGALPGRRVDRATRRSTTATTSRAGSPCSRRRATVGVERVVFSSTAAVYGVPDGTPIPEDAPLRPINPYGEIEADIRERPGLVRPGLRPAQRDASATSTSPARPRRSARTTTRRPTSSRTSSRRPRRGRPLTVFGDDYPTPDGTCIRDYIHVADLADAHLRGDRGDGARRPADRRRRSSATSGTAAASRSARSSTAAEAVVGRADPVTRRPAARRAIRRSSSRARTGRPRSSAGARAPDPRGDGRLGLGLAPGAPGRLPGLTGPTPCLYESPGRGLRVGATLRVGEAQRRRRCDGRAEWREDETARRSARVVRRSASARSAIAIPGARLARGPVVADRPDQPQPDEHRDEQAQHGDLVGAVRRACRAAGR